MSAPMSSSLRLARRLFTTLRRADRWHLRSRLPVGRAQVRLRQLDEWSSRVDLNRSRAYARTPTAAPYAYLYSSSTTPGGREQVGASLSRDLVATLDPETAGPFVEWVRSAETLYGADGPTVPDFVVKLRPGYTPSSQLSHELLANVPEDRGFALH